MRITRIYHSGTLKPAVRIELDERASHHLAHVLRIKPGADLVVFNGAGGEFEARIEAVTKKTVVVQLGKYSALSRESPLDAVLAQGISRGERMDYTIQKAVELGVRRIVPLTTEHTVVNLNAERRERRAQHWRNIAISACEQCGRTVVPEILPAVDLDEWLDIGGSGLKLVLHQEGELGVPDLHELFEPVTILVGPEGGLSNDEVLRARAKGFAVLRLGPRILRTETAGLAALAALQTKWGDMC